MSSAAAVTPEELIRIQEVDRLVTEGAQGVAPLLDRLDDPSWVVRRAVVAGLASLGNESLRPLTELLRSRRDDEARIAATVDALVASLGDAEEEVESLASDDNPAVVADAAQILGRRRATGSVPTLVRLLEHPDDNVAVAAIEALGRIGGRAAVDSLIDIVSSGNFFRVFPAIDVLGRSGDPRAVAPLAALLENPHYGFEAVRALGRTGEKAAVAPLSSLLSRRDDAGVRLAAMALAELVDRYVDRYGDEAGVQEALRARAPLPTAVRRLAQVLREADAAEQVAIVRVLGLLGSEGAVPHLTALLDGAPAVANAAATALKRLGRDSDRPLLDALREGDSIRRRIVLPLVSRSSATEEVIRCLDDRDPTVRALAAEALARIGNPAALSSIFPRLADENPRVVQAAVAAIQSLGSAETERLALEAARSPEPTVRRAALRILAYFGYASALPIFLDALRESDPRQREAAIQGLAFLDDPHALDALLQAARDPDDRTRAMATRALGQAGEDLRVTSYLLKGLSDRDAWVRYYAAQALGRLGIEVAARPIAALLEDPAGQVRVAAVEALAHLQSSLSDEALREAARASDPDVRRAALIGLGLRKDMAAMPLLLEGARAEDPATRLVALSALADLPAPEVPSILVEAARDSDESVRTASIGFLAARPDVRSTLELVGLLRYTPVRELVHESLVVPTEGRVEGLLQSLETADDETAPLLTSALARLRSPPAAAALLQSLTLPNPAARKAAAPLVAALGSREALGALKQAAAQDVDPEVRRLCALLFAP